MNGNKTQMNEKFLKIRLINKNYLFINFFSYLKIATIKNPSIYPKSKLAIKIGPLSEKLEFIKINKKF